MALVIHRLAGFKKFCHTPLEFNQEVVVFESCSAALSPSRMPLTKAKVVLFNNCAPTFLYHYLDPNLFPLGRHFFTNGPHFETREYRLWRRVHQCGLSPDGTKIMARFGTSFGAPFKPEERHLSIWSTTPGLYIDVAVNIENPDRSLKVWKVDNYREVYDRLVRENHQVIIQ